MFSHPRAKEPSCLLRYGRLVAVALFAVVASVSSGYACERAEQSGCLELQFLQIEDNPNNQNVQDLVSGRKTNRDLALTIYHEDVKRERVGLYRSCSDVLVYVWNSAGDSYLGDMRQYDSLEKSSAVTLHQNATSIPYLEEGGGLPTHIFKTEVCDGMGGLQFPREYLGDNSYVLICPLGDTVFPSRPPSPKIQRNGFWFTPEDMRRIKEKKITWELMVLVYKKPKTAS